MVTELLSEKDKDYVLESEMSESELSESEPVPVKRKRGPSKKPLTEVGKTQARKRTNAIFSTLIKECSDQNVPFDKLLAKLALRYYSTPGKSYDKEKVGIFNQIYKGKNPYQHSKLG